MNIGSEPCEIHERRTVMFSHVHIWPSFIINIIE